MDNSTIQVLTSWAAVGAVGFGVYWYYQYKPASGRRAARAPLLNGQEQPERRRVDSKKNRKKDENTSGADQLTSDSRTPWVPTPGDEAVKNRKGKKNKTNIVPDTKSTPLERDSTLPTEIGDGGDDGTDNKEFARRLLGAKTGTSLKPAGQEAKPKKTKKLGKSAEITSGVPEMSSTSSTTGADADDDMSPANSPNMVAQVLSTGVEDMIEAPRPGPSVLKITQPLQPPKNPQPKTKKPAQPQETKKQRQHRMKREAEKLEREQVEKERRIKEENQRRTAREAEGRPAKNGVPVSKPPTKNAWDASVNSSSGTSSTPIQPTNITAEPTALLDTLEEPVVTSASKMNGIKVNGKANTEESVINGPKANGKVKETTKPWHQAVPSEEEQMRMLNEMTEMSGSEGWRRVEKVKKRNKNGQKAVQKDAALSDEDATEYIYPEPPEPPYLSAEDLEGDEPDNRTFAEAVNDLKLLTEVNPLVKEYDPNGPLDEYGHNKLTGHYEPYSQTGHPLDSDWKVC